MNQPIAGQTNQPAPRSAQRGIWGERIGQSVRARARMGGVFELLEAITSTLGQQIVLGMVLVTGDAAATARSILAHEPLYRFGFAASVAGVVFHLAWALVFYQLFKPVSRTLSFFALLVITIGCAMQALAAFFYLGPLVVLRDFQSIGGLTISQTQALAGVLLRLNLAAFQLDLVFFGVWCMLTGYLIWKSGFLPRPLGALLALDGIGWTLYIWPPLATFLFPAIAAASGAAELPLMAWLIAGGVNANRWKERAARSREAEEVRVETW